MIRLGMLFVVAMGIIVLFRSSCSENKTLEYKITSEKGDKPRPPIDVKVWFESPPKIGEEVIINYSVTVDVDVENIAVKISLPQDIILQCGENTWQGNLKKKETKRLSFSCIIPDNKKREIYIAASFEKEGAKASSTSTLTIGKEENKPERKGTIKENEKGEKIIEFEGKTR